MAKAKIIGATTGIAVGATALAVLLGYAGGQLGRAPDQRIAAAEDTYSSTSDPHRESGGGAELVAGGMGGGAAVTYLKFAVKGLRGGKAPARAEVRLSRRTGQLPGRIELTRVPATDWRERTLNARSAPQLGTVVASATPRPHDESVIFDVSRVIQREGTYAFAVTAPAGDGYASFWANEGVPPIDSLVKPTLWLSWIGKVMPWGTATPPTPPSVPVPTISTPAVPGLPTGAPAAGDPDGGSSPPAGLPTGETDPDELPGMPSLPPMPTLPPLPSISGMPTLPPMPTLPTMPTMPTLPATPTLPPTPTIPGTPTLPPTTLPPTPTPPPSDPDPNCTTDRKLVPSCGVLWGVAPGAHTQMPRGQALREFEQKTGRQQAIYHAYHRGHENFPTAEEIEIARERVLFLNWKPQGATWAQVAKGDPATEAYLDKLAARMKSSLTEPFFFTVHHEPENDVDPRRGSGRTATDYAAMVRRVIGGLRERGVSNLVSVMNYMAYVPLNSQPWFERLYPGDDVIDWIAWDAYAYSERGGYGFGDFAEMMNRRSSSKPSWPGFYNWAAEQHPDKPLMVGEWGVWHDDGNPGHRAAFYTSVSRQMPLFPRVKAMVYFDTPGDQRGRDSRVDRTRDGLAAYRELGRERTFQVRVRPAGAATRPTPSP
jgi:hypothetical protein